MGDGIDFSLFLVEVDEMSLLRQRDVILWMCLVEVLGYRYVILIAPLSGCLLM